MTPSVFQKPIMKRFAAVLIASYPHKRREEIAVKKKVLIQGVKKYCRWFRRYMKRVRAIEREIGGELQAC